MKNTTTQQLKEVMKKEKQKMDKSSAFQKQVKLYEDLKNAGLIRKAEYTLSRESTIGYGVSF